MSKLTKEKIDFVRMVTVLLVCAALLVAGLLWWISSNASDEPASTLTDNRNGITFSSATIPLEDTNTTQVLPKISQPSLQPAVVEGASSGSQATTNVGSNGFLSGASSFQSTGGATQDVSAMNRQTVQSTASDETVTRLLRTEVQP